jgi:hypothetical protein
MYAFLIFPVRAICLTHLVLHDFIIIVVFIEELELWSSSLYIVVHCFDTFSLLGPNILSTLFLDTFVCGRSLMRETK